ncbi:hypothetical protein VT06_16190 [Arsukibacterium sp. MJ3]|jgi:hypothetical protein|uniref:hypothetical protein n=1 Tax=Arsukibacterium sp. MJ3 TaxID=1632859 RepID=UPI000627217F|nr:hypothetical protein [Arsukibacterium sp. MJ3]KKO47605.1 hypothetical protein VT06_16190 [Arsukibacterium sp. MJ3]
MPRAAAKIFLKPANITAKAERNIIATLQDIEAAWRRLDKQYRLRDSLFSVFEQQVVPWQHQLSERKAELTAMLLHYANNQHLTERQRLALMDWTNELLEELEYCHFNSPSIDVTTLGKQFMNGFDDQWFPFGEPESDVDYSVDLPEPFASVAALSADEDWTVETVDDDGQWHPVKLVAEKVHLAMAQQLAALLSGQVVGEEGNEQHVKAMLIDCYQQLVQQQLPAESLTPLLTLLARYRHKIDVLSVQLATGETPMGWVLMTFGNYNKAALQPALAEYIADLKYEIKLLRNDLNQCKSLKNLQLLLDEIDLLADNGDEEFNYAAATPNRYH